MLALVAPDPRSPVRDLPTLLLPRDLAEFRARSEARAATIDALLIEGRDLVERAERIVGRLYGLPDDLADEVVASAVQRAAARGREKDEP